MTFMPAMHQSILILSAASLALCTCKPTPRTSHPGSHPDKMEQPAAAPQEKPSATAATPEATPLSAFDPSASLLTVDATQQDFNPLRPWEKRQPSRGQQCGVYLGNGLVLTHGASLDMATYVEIGLPDGSRAVPARVVTYNSALPLGVLTVLHEEDKDIFDSRQAHPIGSPLQRGDEAELWCTLNGTEPLRIPLQAEIGEDDGLPRLLMRASQAVPAGFAFGAPVIKDGKIVGLSAGYQEQTRQLHVINAELLNLILPPHGEEAEGMPVLGIRYTPLTDPVFRRFLKLQEGQSGVYIGTVQPECAAEAAGVQEGDVLTAVNGMPIDNQGRCNLPFYGPLEVGAALRYLSLLNGDPTLFLNRGGEELSVKVPLQRRGSDKSLLPEEKEGAPLRYIVWGGLVFQPLTSTYLDTLKGHARNSLPVEFLELEDRQRELSSRGYEELSALTLVLPTPATLGYDALGFCLVEKVNGKEVHSFSELARLLDEPTPDGIVELTLNKPPYTIYMERSTAEACNDALRRHSIPHLRQMGN